MGVEAMMTGPTDRVLDEGEKPLTAPVAHHGRVGNPPRQCARGRQSRPSRSRGSNGYPNRCFPGTGVQSGTRESGTGATLEDMNQSCRQGRSGARGLRGERNRRRQAQELVASRRVVGIEHAILGDDQPAGVSSPVVALSLSTTV